MVGRIIVALLALGLLPLAGAKEPAWTVERFQAWRDRSPWEGYGVGTQYVTRKTAELPMGGTAKTEKVTETRYTLAKITDEAFHLEVETRTKGNKWGQARSSTIPRKPKRTGTLAVEGEGAIEVDGTSHDCRKIVIRGGKGDDRWRQTWWLNEKHGVLQFEQQIDAGKLKASSTWRVSKLVVRQKAGSKSYVCREIVQTSSLPGGGKSEVTERWTEDAPVRTLWTSGATIMAGLDPIRSTTEVVSIKVKKLKQKR